MEPTDRRARDAFVEVMDSLVNDFDVIDFLDGLAAHCVDLLDVTACGLLAVDHNGTLNLLGASAEQAWLLELFRLQSTEGPCLEAYRRGVPVSSPDLAGADSRWPRFAPAARAAGFTSAFALPMRLREVLIGAMSLLSAGKGVLDGDTLDLGRALADAATIGILHQRAVLHREVVTEQLQGALNGRILIEQAKGFLAERHGISVDEAFGTLRDHARAGDRRLLDVARSVIEGSVTVAAPARPGTGWVRPPAGPRDTA